MVNNIYLTKAEKLAIIKILLEINSYYSHRLPQALKIVQETAILFKEPNSIVEATNISIAEARDTIRGVINQPGEYWNFFIHLLSYFLGTSKYGIYQQVDKLVDRDDYTEYSQSKEGKQYVEFLQNEFQEEWKFAFEIFGDMFGYFPLYYVAGVLMWFKDENPLKNSQLRFINTCKTNTAITDLIKTAESGDAISQYELSLRYYYGKGVERDGDKSILWMQKAAKQGCADAQYELACCYDEGEIVEQNHSIAFYWYEKASHNGHPEAMTNLGICFSLGQGCVKDYNQAIEWWEKAANLGNANAFYNLGNSYAEGNIVERDISRATELLQRAKKLGCERASIALVMIDDDVDYCDDDIDGDYNYEDSNDVFDVNKLTYTKSEQNAIIHIAAVITFNNGWKANEKRLLNAIGNRFNFSLQETNEALKMNNQLALATINSMDNNKKKLASCIFQSAAMADGDDRMGKPQWDRYFDIAMKCDIPMDIPFSEALDLTHEYLGC